MSSAQTDLHAGCTRDSSPRASSRAWPKRGGINSLNTVTQTKTQTMEHCLPLTLHHDLEEAGDLGVQLDCKEEQGRGEGTIVLSARLRAAGGQQRRSAGYPAWHYAADQHSFPLQPPPHS